MTKEQGRDERRFFSTAELRAPRTAYQEPQGRYDRGFFSTDDIAWGAAVVAGAFVSAFAFGYLFLSLLTETGSSGTVFDPYGTGCVTGVWQYERLPTHECGPFAATLLSNRWMPRAGGFAPARVAFVLALKVAGWSFLAAVVWRALGKCVHWIERTASRR